MAKKRKHQFHCEKCGSPCEIYSKGKKHRVLVCPQCGVIATNPLPLVAGLVARGVAKKAIGAVAPLLGGKKEEKKDRPFIVKDNYSTEERVRDALK